LGARDTCRVPGIDLAAADDEPLGGRRYLLELSYDLGRELAGQEADLIALRVGRHLSERIALHDPCELRAGAYDDWDVEAELVRQEPLALSRHLLRGAVGREHDVAALDVGLHVRELGVR